MLLPVGPWAGLSHCRCSQPYRRPLHVSMTRTPSDTFARLLRPSCAPTLRVQVECAERPHSDSPATCDEFSPRISGSIFSPPSYSVWDWQRENSLIPARCSKDNKLDVSRARPSRIKKGEKRSRNSVLSPPDPIAAERTRTSTGFLPLDPKSSASANSATAASLRGPLSLKTVFCQLSP